MKKISASLLSLLISCSLVASAQDKTEMEKEKPVPVLYCSLVTSAQDKTEMEKEKPVPSTFADFVSTIYKNSLNDADDKNENSFDLPLLFYCYNGQYGWKYQIPFLLSGADEDYRDWVKGRNILTPLIGYSKRYTNKNYNITGSYKILYSILLLTVYMDANKLQKNYSNRELPISLETDGISPSSSTLFFSLLLWTHYYSDRNSLHEKENEAVLTKFYSIMPLLTKYSLKTKENSETNESKIMDSYYETFLLYKRHKTESRTSNSSFYGFLYYADSNKSKDQLEIGPGGIFFRYMKTPDNLQKSVLYGFLYSSDSYENTTEYASLWEILFSRTLSEKGNSFELGPHGIFTNYYANKKTEFFSILKGFIYSSEENEESFSRDFGFIGYSKNKKTGKLSLELRFFWGEF